jgi:DNA polymerase-3 subunit delta
MFIFLYGEDTFLSSRKLQEIVNGYKKVHKTGLNLIYFDCQNSDFEEFQNSVQSVSMFQEKKLIILRNAFLNTFFKDKFLDWAPNCHSERSEESQSIVVIYENQVVKKTDKLFKFLKSKAKIQEFSFLVGVKLQNWVDKEFEKYGTRIDFAARAKLINFVGSDLWQMSQEIRKLCAYAGSSSLRGGVLPDAAIFAHDVELLVIPKIETDIFKTIDAIALNNKKLAFLLLHKHLAKGDAPLYLLSMINFQFRNLLVVRDFTERHGNVYGSVRIPGMHPYVAQKSLAQARNFTFDKLKKIYYKLLAIDTGIKTGRVEPRMALDMLIIQI